MALIDHGLASAIVSRAAAGALPGRFGWSPHQPFPKTVVFDWDLSGSCSYPVLVRKESDRRVDRPVEVSYRIDQAVRCRKCDSCMRARQWHWMQRGVMEHMNTTMNKGRSWMVTLTCNPEARKELIDETGSIDPSQLAVCLSSWVTRWLKSIRHAPRDAWRARKAEASAQWKAQNPGRVGVRSFLRERFPVAPRDIQFKYVLVIEQHKDGFPHAHLIMHEQPFSAPLRKAFFRKYWKKGFSRANLVLSAGAGLYVCKYLTKDSLARVRASSFFGKQRPQVQATAGKRENNAPQRAARCDDDAKAAEYTSSPYLNKEERKRDDDATRVVMCRDDESPFLFTSSEKKSAPGSTSIVFSRLYRELENVRLSNSISKLVRTKLRRTRSIWLSKVGRLRAPGSGGARAKLSYSRRVRYWLRWFRRTTH